MNGIAKFFLFPIGFVVVVTVECSHLYKIK